MQTNLNDNPKKSKSKLGSILFRSLTKSNYGYHGSYVSCIPHNTSTTPQNIHIMAIKEKKKFKNICYKKNCYFYVAMVATIIPKTEIKTFSVVKEGDTMYNLAKRQFLLKILYPLNTNFSSLTQLPHMLLGAIWKWLMFPKRKIAG